MGKNQHVIPKSGKWQVKGEGNSRATTITNTQKQAISIAKSIAKTHNAEVFIHGLDGRIREKISYGNEHFSSKD